MPSDGSGEETSFIATTMAGESFLSRRQLVELRGV